jgi:hypothetical protein
MSGLFWLKIGRYSVNTLTEAVRVAASRLAYSQK